MRCRLSALALMAVLASGCDVTINSSGTGTGTGTGGGSGSGPTSPTPPTPLPPGVPTPTGPRTPDPPVGVVLPFPGYAAGVVAGVTVPVSASCLSFAYLDAVVDALRLHDTRWGYACGSAATTGCAAASLDKIAYHATAGAETTGVTGNWLVDLITDVCGAAGRNFGVSYDTTAGWTARGRF